jgi:hypothetical protein
MVIQNESAAFLNACNFNSIIYLTLLHNLKQLEYIFQDQSSSSSSQALEGLGQVQLKLNIINLNLF